MENSLNTPILLIGYNRPSVIKESFACIRSAKPKRLYIAIDGPRNHIDNDEKLVEEVKHIIKQVDWDCKVLYNFNKTNKGCEITVSSAISWALEYEEYIIILEDDIVAPLAFFRFAEEMLIKYKDNERIAIVSGSNFTPIYLPNNEDYLFAKYGHTWGWATWKRFWKKFDLNMSVPDEHLKTDFLKSICSNRSEIYYYSKVFQKIKLSGPGNTTWDFVLLYLLRISNSISVIPKINLTSNIGVFGLHARGKSEHHFRTVDQNFIVKTHPERIECNIHYDKIHFKSYINKKPHLFKRVLNKIFRIIDSF